MEPWDGPALIAFTDGSVIGAVLDRNGLRPGRYWVTSDGLVVLASEVGVLDIDPAAVVRKGRLQPGRIFLADTSSGRIVEDEEVKSALAAEHPYQDWLHAGLLHLDALPAREDPVRHRGQALATRQQLFGYTEEEAVQYFLQNVSFIASDIARIVIRAHPSEPEQKYAWARERVSAPLDISEGKSLIEDIAAQHVEEFAIRMTATEFQALTDQMKTARRCGGQGLTNSEHRVAAVERIEGHAAVVAIAVDVGAG